MYWDFFPLTKITIQSDSENLYLILNFGKKIQHNNINLKILLREQSQIVYNVKIWDQIAPYCAPNARKTEKVLG